MMVEIDVTEAACAQPLLHNPRPAYLVLVLSERRFIHSVRVRGREIRSKLKVIVKTVALEQTSCDNVSKNATSVLTITNS